MKALSEEWVQVYRGNAALAEMVHARLREHGVRAFVADRNLHYVHPGYRGGNVLELDVLVAREQLQQAHELLALDAEAGAQLCGPGDDALERQQREVQRLGDRLIAAVFLVYLSPLALVLAPRYFKLARALPTRPRRYRTVQAATVLAVFLLAAGVALLVLTPW